MRETCIVLSLIMLSLSLVYAQSEPVLIDAAVLYNQGMRYEKTDEPAQAILAFQRAALAAPRDADIRQALARVVPQTVTTPLSITLLTEAVANLLTLREHTTLLFLAWNGLFLIALVSLFRTRWRSTLLPLRLISLTICISLGLLLAGRIYTDTYQPLAVVLQPTFSWSGPGEDYLQLTTVPPASLVRIVDQRNHWIRVTLPNQTSVWMALEGVERVIPLDLTAVE